MDLNNKINLLSKFFYKNKDNIENNIIDNNKEIINKIENKIIYNDNFDKNNFLNIYWCIIILKYGYNHYKLLDDDNKNNYLFKEKQKWMIYIKENPKCYKNINHKITNNIFQEIITDCITHIGLNFKDLFIISLFYEINILLIYENINSYIEIINNNINYDKNNLIKIYKKNKKYGCYYKLYDNNDNLIMNEINIDNFIKWNTYTKPLKSLSSYKKKELIDIYNKIIIDNKDENIDKMKKEDIYKNIETVMLNSI